jgi:hypothetical protein
MILVTAGRIVITQSAIVARMPDRDCRRFLNFIVSALAFVGGADFCPSAGEFFAADQARNTIARNVSKGARPRHARAVGVGGARPYPFTYIRNIHLLTFLAMVSRRTRPPLRTWLVWRGAAMWRAEIAQTRVRLGAQPCQNGLSNPRLSDTGFARYQHDAAVAVLGLLPKAQHQIDLFVATD